MRLSRRQVDVIQMDNLATVARSSKALLPENSDFEFDVVAGLSSDAKWLPSKYFYDASGSALFEHITRVPEYYVTRSEIGILSGNRAAIGSLFPSNSALIELGAGSSRKARILLGATASIAAYVPVDISGDFLREDVAKVRSDFPHLAVLPIICDFTGQFRFPEGISSLSRVGFFPGSTIGNYEPAEARQLLQHLGRTLGKNSILVAGVDLVKDSHVLTSAYNDSGGVTAQFNLNLLKRINRELEATFDLTAFKHNAIFDAEKSRVEMHLVSLYRQEVRVRQKVFQFYAGETIHTENSYKYTVDSFQTLAGESGWSTLGLWTDGLFSVHAFAIQ